MNHEIAAMNKQDNWQTKVLITGGAIGAVLGLMTSWLLIRTARETRGGPPAISTGDAIKVGITTIGLVRAIAALGDRP
ncbi:MAG: hypothetical protein KIS95_10980 [Anaerolineae bacterium]|nr:hypothetical protein [Anaerolineales bacterium]MCW5847745.1 hypothetical protein [Anaerolineae bacterium]